MKKLTALFCLAAMVLLFSGCSSSGGAESCNLLINAYASAVTVGDAAKLHDLFSFDHFAPEAGAARGVDIDGNPVIYNVDDLLDLPFWNTGFGLSGQLNVVGENRNSAELAVLAQEMYGFANLDLEISKQSVISATFTSTSYAPEDTLYYDLIFDVICVRNRYYIQSVTILSETPDSASGGYTGSDTDTEPEYYTLEQAKEQGGFFVLSEDRFYPLLEAYEANWDGYDYYVTAISDEIPMAGGEGQLVMFGDSGNSTSVTITAASDLGTTIPLALIFHEQLGYCIRDLLFYSNTEPRIAEEVAHLSDAVWNGLHDLAENVDENYLGFANENGVVIDNISGIEDISTFEFLELETRGLGFAYSCMLKCDEGEWVTIGYYVGTSYYEFEIPAVARYWATGQSAPYVRQEGYDVEFEKTRDGYFVVPLDELPDGVYSIDNYKLFEVG